MKKIIIGLTGATGSVFFKKLLEILILEKCEIYVVATKTGEEVFEYEIKNDFKKYIESLNYQHLHLCPINDMFNKIASGSFQVDGMIILPCSMGTIGKIANGTSDHLLIRACDVQLKEKRKVLIAFREAPLSSIHLNNLLTLQQAGAIIFPLVPAFYHHPKDLDEVINQIVFRILSYFDVSTEDKIVWEGI
ncbi:UbiX family flavin prenyltransferase [Mycoplasmatota bacterium]|nr:UbiX family flavin prenyltransferase [Mycoplasmatota bacterium]